MMTLRKLIGVCGSVLVFVLFGKAASEWGGPTFRRWAAGGPWRERRLRVRPAPAQPGTPEHRAAPGSR